MVDLVASRLTRVRSGLALVAPTLVAVFALILVASSPADEEARYWPQWCGPLGTGGAVGFVAI